MTNLLGGHWKTIGKQGREGGGGEEKRPKKFESKILKEIFQKEI